MSDNVSTSSVRMSRSRASVRVAVLAVSCVACSLVSALAAFRVFLWSLPSSDGAYGEPYWRMLQVPTTFLVLSTIVLTGAAFGFVASILFLWRTQLSRSIPLVAGTTIMMSAVLGWLGMFAAVPSLLAALWAMDRSRRKFAATDLGAA